MTVTTFNQGYVRRIVDAELDALLPALPAILLDGPKAIGKTETARQRANTIRQLSTTGVRSVARADPTVVLAGPPPVLLDEWQRVPAVWDAVKIDVDRDPSGGRFLLTGSMPDGGTHSGAGRIVTIRMRPLSVYERGVADTTVSLADLLSGTRPALSGTCTLTLADYTELILASGFPAFQGLPLRARNAQLDSYLERIVNADLREAGTVVRRPATITAWMRAYAAATSTTATWETIRKAATPGTSQPPAKSTTLPYIEVLTRLGILDAVPAWLPTHNHLDRVGQAPKHHLADPALAARLVGSTTARLLSGGGPKTIPRDGTFLGGLFESLVTLSVRVYAQAAEADAFHLRMHNGRHEVDLILQRDDGKVLAIEAKLAAAIDGDDVRHLLWLKERIGDDLLDMAVITTGEQAYRRPDGVAVIPLALLGP